MKYTVTRLDGRFSYREWFEYYIGFPSSMSNRQGPVRYNDALKWFFQTYGWSAEIRQYGRIMQWTFGTYVNTLLNQKTQATGILSERSEHCNPHWSWTDHYPDLRVYLASDKELAFFQLAHPVDQK